MDVKSSNELPVIATFMSEADQVATLPARIETCLIAPMTRLRDALKRDIDRLSNTVKAHAELANYLYNDTLADGQISVGSQAFYIGKTQVEELAKGRAKELADRIAMQMERIRGVEKTIEELEASILDILGSITIGGQRLA